MQTMKRKKLMPTTLMVLLSVVALGGFLPVNPGNTLLITGGEAWASSLGARRGVGTSAGAGGGAVGAGPVLPPGAPRGARHGRRNQRRRRRRRGGRGPRAPPGAPPGLQWLPQEGMCGEKPASFVLPTALQRRPYEVMCTPARESQDLAGPPRHGDPRRGDPAAG